MLRNRKDKYVYNSLQNRYTIPPRLITILKEHLPKHSKIKNLYIHGKSGTGKTIYSIQCAYLVLKNISIPLMNNTLVFLSVSEFLVSIKQYYKKSQSDPMYGIVKKDNTTTTFEERLMDKCKSAKLLILDDLGTGKSTDWTNEMLYSIINARYNSDLKIQKTIITSNFSPDVLKEKVDNRIASRIFDMCDPILFEKQYRKQ